MSYERNKIIGLLYRIFQAEDFQWYKDGAMKTPSYNEIEEFIEELEESAYKCKGSSETGRVRVNWDKEANMYEYFFNLGVD